MIYMEGFFDAAMSCLHCLEKVGVDVKGSHVYRAWGDMYRQSMAFRDPSGPEGLLFLAFSRKLQELDDALNRCIIMPNYRLHVAVVSTCTCTRTTSSLLQDVWK